MSDAKKKVDYDALKVAQVKIGNKKATNEEYLYMEFRKDVSFKAGDKLYLNDFVQGLENSVKAGRISQDKADELKAKLSFLIYEVNLPAPR